MLAAFIRKAFKVRSKRPHQASTPLADKPDQPQPESDPPQLLQRPEPYPLEHDDNASKYDFFRRSILAILAFSISVSPTAVCSTLDPSPPPY